MTRHSHSRLHLSTRQARSPRFLAAVLGLALPLSGVGCLADSSLSELQDLLAGRLAEPGIDASALADLDDNDPSRETPQLPPSADESGSENGNESGSGSENGSENDPCSIEIHGPYTAAVGETLQVEWTVEASANQPSESIYFAFFSGWSPAEYYVSEVIANTGSFELELPEGLDPELEYHLYMESAEDGVPSEECWNYTEVEVLEADEPHCEVEILSPTRMFPGEDVEITWEMSGDLSPEVMVSVYSEWGETYYLYTATENSGVFHWEAPEDLDPTLEYHAAVVSAEDGQATDLCWNYQEIEVF